MPTYTLDGIKARVESLRLDREFPARGSGYKGYTAKMLTFWRLDTAHQAAYLKNNSGMPNNRRTTTVLRMQRPSSGVRISSELRRGWGSYGRLTRPPLYLCRRE